MVGFARCARSTHPTENDSFDIKHPSDAPQGVSCVSTHRRSDVDLRIHRKRRRTAAGTTAASAETAAHEATNQATAKAGHETQCANGPTHPAQGPPGDRPEI